MNNSLARRAVICCVFLFAGASARAQQAPPAAPPTQPAQPAPTVPGGLNLNGASLLEVINLLARICTLLHPRSRSARRHGHGSTLTAPYATSIFAAAGKLFCA